MVDALKPQPQVKQKHVPMRTCIVTREKLPKSELIRLVHVIDENGTSAIEVDLRNKLNGRCANIKPDPQVLKSALEKGIIERALKLNRKLGPAEKVQLAQDFEQALEEREFRPRNQKIKLKVSQAEFAAKLN